MHACLDKTNDVTKMRFLLIFSFLLLLLPSILMASCDGTASILVPAVVGDGSGLVNISVRIITGDGSVFLSAFPQTGTSTQDSVEKAVRYAFLKSNSTKCDAIVAIDTSGSAGYVEGPSAGGAFTVMAFAALNNMTPRHDAVMTGTIEQDGSIGPVGGVYEKALAASASGAKYFVLPKMNLFDMLLLRNLQKQGLEVIEVTDADSAIGFMLYNASIHQQDLERKPDPVPDLDQYDASGMERFRDVATEMIDFENAVVESMPSIDNESASIKNYYKLSIDRQKAIKDKGYYFSAANEAFLDYIQASTVRAMLLDQPDLGSKKKEIEDCLNSITINKKTDANLEWAIGSDLRLSWAQLRLNSTDITRPKLLEEKYLVYNELMYSDAWCKVSKVLAEAGNSENTSSYEIDESAWMPFAQSQLDKAEEIQITDPDLKERLASSKQSFISGRYGASIFDATYVIAMFNANTEMAEMSPGNLSKEIDSMLKEKRSSLWGKVYQAQGAFLASGDVSDFPSAFRILRFAKAIDQVSSGLKGAPIKQASTTPYMLAESPDMGRIIALMSILLIITMLLFFIAARKAAPKGMGYDTDTEGKRYRRIPGADKKQG